MAFITCTRLLLLFLIYFGHVQNGAGTTTIPGSRSKATVCGGRLTGDHGLIITPNYPVSYDINSTCQWRIEVNTSHVIKLTFYEPFDLEPDNSCNYDSVQVFDVMPDGTLNQRGTWCGSSPPPDVTSSTNKMVVVLNSDYKTTYKGFSASWKSVISCGGIFNTSEGNMISPDYPYPYPENLRCRWDISVPDGTHFVNLDFNGGIDLDVKPDGSCGQDVIEIFDSFGDNQLISRAKLCGSPNSISPILSQGSRIVVEFRSDNNLQNANGRGFAIKWSTNSSCHHHQSDSHTGYLMSYDYSPSLNNRTPNNSHCDWTISAPGHDTSQFHIKMAFDTTHHALQCQDFLVTDTDHSRVSLCSVLINNTVTSSSSHMTLFHVPSGGNSSNPFFASWEIVCGGVLTDHYGTIHTPEYPSGYPSNLECIWEIRDSDPRQHFIQLEFDPAFDVEYNSTHCGSDYVQVLSVPPGHPPIVLGTWCGGTAPPPQVSYYSPLMVVFRSDETKSHAGFTAKWASGVGCDNVIRGEHGTLSFPNINYTYPNDYRCSWDIHVPDNYVVQLDVVPGFELEKGADMLKVYDTLPSGYHRLSTTLTGFLGAKRLLSQYSAVRLQFLSDHSVNYRGFTINWSASCGGIFDSSFGNLSTPSYGSRDYLNDLDCEWRINVPTHHSIHLDFQAPFELEATNDVTCPYDHLEVFDAKPDGQLLSRGRFCGHGMPPAIVSTTSSMVLQFHSDGDKTGKGFGLTWDSSCGNVYRNKKGTVKSPNYPNLYPNSFDCRWEIDVQPGNVIRLSFQQPFSLESDENCRYDFVEVFDVNAKGQEVRLGHWCGSNMPPLQLSTGNHMVVTFHSDDGKNGEGFEALYEAVCGDVFYSFHGNFTSPLYPHGYPGNMDCRWEINLDPGQRIQLTFDRDFDLELNRYDCGYDDVQVLDSFSNQTLISNGKWCGQNRPPVITSFNERLVILFHSDVNKDGKGFSLSWVAVPGCGGVYDRESGYLMSTNHPDQYPNGHFCQWEIKPRDQTKTNITLTFDSVFQMEAGKSCEYDFIKVTDGTNSIGRYCGKTPPPPLTSTTGHMIIQFTSDKSNSGKGFFASWTTS